MKTSLYLLQFALITITGSSAFAIDCTRNVKAAAENLATLNDLSPNPSVTSVLPASVDKPGTYSVTTSNAGGTRIGSITVILNSPDSCRIYSVSDDDAAP